jgi:hypothetical protein
MTNWKSWDDTTEGACEYGVPRASFMKAVAQATRELEKQLKDVLTSAALLGGPPVLGDSLYGTEEEGAQPVRFSRRPV